MPASAPSNIRAYVHWKEPTVYAGEEVECIITFKNIAAPPRKRDGELSQAPPPNGNTRERRQSITPTTAASSRRASIAQGKLPPSGAPSTTTNARGAPTARGHRPALSLNVVSAQSRAGLNTTPLPAKPPNSAVNAGRGHGRSLSIISLGSDARSDGRTQQGSVGKRPVRGHVRSASLQVMPKSVPQSGAGPVLGSSRQPSPLYESTTTPTLPEAPWEPLPIRPARRRPGTVSAGNTPQLSRQFSHDKAPSSGQLPRDFQFPPNPSERKGPSPQQERPKLPRNPSALHSAQNRTNSPRAAEAWPGPLSNLNPVTRVRSESSIGGTPRSSSEFYSMSNHSDETLTSEVPSQNQQNSRLQQKPPHSRQASQAKQNGREKPAQPETLMMGYAQTMANFTLDGGLVNAAPFEEVKRKGVQGGGGVVGIERTKRPTGMFGAFGWGNIGESLNGLLGSHDMSSMAQMKASVSSKAIPLLSTPQSLLFVDLRLAPGECRCYNYRFALPRGLPPSHKGRAIKVNYYLAIGVQRTGEQAVKRIEIPFRVLGSYNSRGESLAHDLMSPYVLLQDAARTTSITPGLASPSAFPSFAPRDTKRNAKPAKKGLEDFLRYTERLIAQPKEGNGALVSPPSPTSLTPSLSRQQSLGEQAPANIKQAINLAILHSNHVHMPGRQRPSDAQSANRFSIARSGQPVAVLTLLRPAYRLGEAVIGTIDFTAPPADADAGPQAPTYATLLELESVERVDASLALRSSNSINRVTRKVYASLHENTLFARRISFNLTIPSTATPSFETTGVSLLWTLKVHFTTQRQKQPAHGLGIGAEQDEGPEEGLLEELGTDDRGKVLIAKERLAVETFEVSVPLTVYGAPAAVDAVGGENDELEV